jgi:mannose-6-phosphate isomerase-like protein (cupin superfamily)
MTDRADAPTIEVGRYLEKAWDWDAFPANSGYAELERAQMRYVGAGGSPKTGDRTTLPPGAFTCSLIFQEPGRKASVHHHQIEELFFVHRGQLTMSWQFGDETVDFVVGPGDAVLNPPTRPHGFRNDGDEACLMQIMVATAAPMLPTYTDHPADHPTSPLRPAAPERAGAYLAQVEPYLCRARDAVPQAAAVHGGTFTAAPYVMSSLAGGRVTPTHFTFALDVMTRGAQTPVYARDVEEAFMVLDGVLDIEQIDALGAITTTRLGPRDLAFVPAGVQRRLVNRDASSVRFAAMVGAVDAQPFGWIDALAVSPERVVSHA